MKLISQPAPEKAEIPLHETPKGLPKQVPSICPECREQIDAILFEKEGKVFMRKSCPSHGVYEDLIYSDVEMYLKMEKWTFQDAEGINNPIVKNATNCPSDCGLCNMHISTACMTIIDLTNRCNLTCPYCFANANVAGFEYTVSRKQITEMLQNVRAIRPQRCKTIQFAGGEPTIHPDFLWAVSEAKRVGFPYVIIATNGITFGKSLEFAHQAKAAGVDALYLQFDGDSDDVYRETRAADLGKLKMRCIRNCERAGIRVVLVPTLVKGVNEDQIGGIIRTAIDHLDVVNGVSFQPVSFTGRISYEERLQQRFTISDLAWEIYDQTGIAHPMRDWYPLSFVSPLSRLMETLSGKDIMTISCHSDCGIGCYLVINRDGEAYPITQFVDLEGAMTELNILSEKLRSIFQRPIFFAQAIRIFRKYYKPQLAPPGLSFGDLLGALGPTLFRTRSHIGKMRRWRFLILLGMHFQDVYNFNIHRVKRCVIHYAAPNGRIYPFCAYNSGPLFRERVEGEFSKPLGER
ncbi:MAG: radical SAM protein [Candidatus Latescibacteria bacterium]|nr:radical SAM protein [Candidatus Latescibacterota bacterium]NIM22284.1 radical SAM protein [Candidatus Latescibacterota bacterium]NIM65763.1 radical SAM protein [Candidatus Latescibacterota bacterium]NIO02148.1 radical SAM protein [Candidatus Latescibacterota bacterium]NIO78488.1 radical SAM protein [Candidatus Latescibacterota bacterium]